jgi:imidazolonepropionase-like amidohydrolase
MLQRMKKIIVFFWILIASINALSQSYPPSIHQFVSYDAAVIAFTHCYLADVIKLKVDSDQTVIIRHGIIEKIGKFKNLTIPPDALVIDCTGKSLLPGFVLMHEHMFYPAVSVFPEYVHFKQLPVTFPKLYLACGATTIRTAGSMDPYSDLALKREIDQQKVIGPTMYLTSPYMEGKNGFDPEMPVINSPEEARTFVNYWAEQGITSFKAYRNLDTATLRSCIDAVHAKGLKITGHLCAVTYKEAANMGIDQLEHGFMASTDFIPGKKENECVSTPDPLANADLNGQPLKELIQLLVNRKVILTSTLAVFYGLSTLDSFTRPEVLEAMAPDTREMYLKYYSKEKSSLFNESFKKDLKMEKMFSDAGGLLTVGTDPTGNGNTLAGYGSQLAIELLVQEGFTPIESVRIASYNGALALGIQDKIGSIEPGKAADLVVIDGNIAHEIKNIESVEWVFRHGIGFDSKKLFALVKGQVGNY